jgi:hypothetical protein
VLHNIDRQSAKWAGLQIASYEFTAKYVCICPWAGELIRIRVSGETVDASYLEYDVAIEDGYLEYLLGVTIDDTFSGLRDKIEGTRARSVFVSFDPNYGFPASVEIDYSWFQTDDTYHFYITDFAVTTGGVD